jgi:hypothetical protein
MNQHHDSLEETPEEQSPQKPYFGYSPSAKYIDSNNKSLNYSPGSAYKRQMK